MTSKSKGIAFFLFVFIFSFVRAESDTPYLWNYKKGGNDWPDICKTGERQSPINIVMPYYASPNQISFHYLDKVENIKISNNDNYLESPEQTGNTIQISGHFGFMTYGDNRFEAIQIHFHVPSNHKLYGKQFDAEMHIVHINKWRQEVIVGVLLTKYFRDNDFLKSIGWGNFPDLNQTKSIDVAQGLSFLNTKLTPIITYKGSLESPPCTEGVLWFILLKNSYISKKQLSQWPTNLLNNVRIPQPLNHRSIKMI